MYIVISTFIHISSWLTLEQRLDGSTWRIRQDLYVLTTYLCTRNLERNSYKRMRRFGASCTRTRIRWLGIWKYWYEYTINFIRCILICKYFSFLSYVHIVHRDRRRCSIEIRRGDTTRRGFAYTQSSSFIGLKTLFMVYVVGKLLRLKKIYPIRNIWQKVTNTHLEAWHHAGAASIELISLPM